jgi:hypothetical protein
MVLLLALLAAAATAASAATVEDRLENPIAIFSGLDKITGQTTSFEVRIGEEKRFGGLAVKADVCYSRPVTEEPKTTSFVEVDEVDANAARKRVFSGWMFAESPGLNAVEHPIYDVWLTGCRDPNAPPPVVEAVPIETPPEISDDAEIPDD